MEGGIPYELIIKKFVMLPIKEMPSVMSVTRSFRAASSDTIYERLKQLMQRADISVFYPHGLQGRFVGLKDPMVTYTSSYPSYSFDGTQVHALLDVKHFNEVTLKIPSFDTDDGTSGTCWLATSYDTPDPFLILSEDPQQFSCVYSLQNQSWEWEIGSRLSTMAKVTLTGKLVNDKLSLIEARLDYETVMGYWQGRESLLTLLEKTLESAGPMWS